MTDLGSGAALSRSFGNSYRWFQLFAGVICMTMVANLQYGWTLFVDPIDAKTHWGRPAIQAAFSIFVLTETWLVPVEAWFVDKYGPRIVIMFGGVMVALAWVLNSIASEMWMLYLGAIIGGMGVGAVYGTCVGNALKWFPDRRGLAAGSTAAGFGAGAALTIVPIANMIKTSGYESAFFNFGVGQGIVVFLLALFIRSPSTLGPAIRRPPKFAISKVSYTPGQSISKPIFWLLYLCFVMVACCGVTLAAQIAPMAKDFNVGEPPVSLAGVTMAALPFALFLDRIFDGFGRPFFGWVSDSLGRENTMLIAFSTAAISLFILATYGSNPVVFVCFSALYFGVFGEIYSLFPSTCGDTFGPKFAATNAGMLYTAKGTASFLVPLASTMAGSVGWYNIFIFGVALNAAAALIALFVVKPVRARHIAQSQVEAAPATALKPAE